MAVPPPILCAVLHQVDIWLDSNKDYEILPEYDSMLDARRELVEKRNPWNYVCRQDSEFIDDFIFLLEEVERETYLPVKKFICVSSKALEKI